MSVATPPPFSYNIWNPYVIYTSNQSVNYLGTVFTVNAGQKTLLGVPPVLGVIWNTTQPGAGGFVSLTAADNLCYVGSSGTSTTIIGTRSHIDYLRNCSGTVTSIPLTYNSSIVSQNVVPIMNSYSSSFNTAVSVNLLFNATITLQVSFYITGTTFPLVSPPFTILCEMNDTLNLYGQGQTTISVPSLTFSSTNGGIAYQNLVAGSIKYYNVGTIKPPTTAFKITYTFLNNVSFPVGITTVLVAELINGCSWSIVGTPISDY